MLTTMLCLLLQSRFVITPQVRTFAYRYNVLALMVVLVLDYYIHIHV